MVWDAKRPVDWNTLVQHTYPQVQGGLWVIQRQTMKAVLMEAACWTKPFMCDVLLCS